MSIYCSFPDAPEKRPMGIANNAETVAGEARFYMVDTQQPFPPLILGVSGRQAKAHYLLHPFSSSFFLLHDRLPRLTTTLILKAGKTSNFFSHFVL